MNHESAQKHLAEAQLADHPVWVTPPVWDGSAEVWDQYVDMLALLNAGQAKVWLGSFPLPATGNSEDASLSGTSVPAEVDLVVPTSGSTGKQKSVALALSALKASNQATEEFFGGKSGAWLAFLPPTHIAGIQVVLRSLAYDTTGHTSLGHAWQIQDRGLPQRYEQQPSAAGSGFSARSVITAFNDLVQKNSGQVPEVIFTSLVPTQLERIRQAESSEAFDLESKSGAPATATCDSPAAEVQATIEILRSLEAVLLGGAAASPDLLSWAKERGINVVTTYGSSETAGGCFYNRQALNDVSGFVVDSDPINETRIGEELGRLVITGPTLALGYLGTDGALTSGDAFTTEHVQRSFITSDLATFDVAGKLTILGRADDAIISGGKKIHPAEIERALNALPEVSSAVVVGVPDREWGEQAVALIVPNRTQAADIRLNHETPEAALTALNDKLRAHGLAGWQLPKRYFTVPELPLLGIGKIDRAQCKAIALNKLNIDS